MMKKLIFALMFILACSFTANAQFQSVQSGKWYWASTWSTDPNATAIPHAGDDVTVKHDINIDGSGECNNLTVEAGGRIHNGTLNVNGNLVNSGVINGRDEWNGMRLNLKGDLQNYGIYDSDTYFESSTTQYIAAPDTLRLGKCYVDNTSAIIVFTEPTILADSWIFLKGAQMMINDTLKIINTSLDGGIINGGNNNTLLSIGSQNHIGWQGAVSFGPQYTELKNLVLAGNTYIYGSGEIGNAYATGIGENVVNNGFLSYPWLNGGGTSSIHILKDFVNNGRIADNQDKLYLIFDSGNFTNNGRLENSSLIFRGTHTFTNTADSLWLNEIIGADSSTIINMDGDFIFAETITIDLQGGVMNLTPESKFLATFEWHNIFKRGTLNANNSSLKFPSIGIDASINNNARIEYLSFGYNSYLQGDFEILNKGTLISFSNSWPRVVIDGDLTNRGNIRNHYSSGELYLDITGNIVHDGAQWSNAETKLNGIQDQTVSIPNDSSWTGKLVLDAMLAGTNYQWQKDGVDINGENSQLLTFSSGISTVNYGVYQCIVDGNSSRQIVIGSAALPSLEITDVVITNLNATETKVDWKTTVPAKGFIFYAENDTSSGYPLEAMESTGYLTEHSLTLENLTTGSTYYFVIDQMDNDNNWLRTSPFSFVAGDTTTAVNSFEKVPVNFSLSQNYPNPFNPSTTINYSIPQVIASGAKQSDASVKLIIYDLLGGEVATLVNEKQLPGRYSVTFDAAGLSSGIYFYRLTAGKFLETKKMILLK